MSHEEQIPEMRQRGDDQQLDQQRCQGTTAKGRACGLPAADGKAYCPTHDPERWQTAPVASRARVAGTRTDATEVPSLGSVVGEPDADRYLVALGDAVVAGAVAPLAAREAAAILRELLALRSAYENEDSRKR